MVHTLVRKVEATNLFFSSWILVFSAVGITIEEWTVLKLGPQDPIISHSPWICCTSLWTAGQLYYGKRWVEYEGSITSWPFC